MRGESASAKWRRLSFEFYQSKCKVHKNHLKREGSEWTYLQHSHPPHHPHTRMWQRLTQLASPSKKKLSKAQRRASAPAAISPTTTAQTSSSSHSNTLDFGRSAATPHSTVLSAVKVSPTHHPPTPSLAFTPANTSLPKDVKHSPETIHTYILSSDVKALKSFLNSLKGSTRNLDDSKYTLFHVIHATLVSCCSIGSLPSLNAVLEFIKKVRVVTTL